MRILSGIRTSLGELHIGNYSGALAPYLELQKKHECFFFLADWHAITTPYEPETFQKDILETAATYLALGINPKKAVLFVQSHVPQHLELAWLLGTLTPMGELERMTQYKEKIQEGITANFGLFAYPILMAADILIYKPQGVPVGEDQKQHVELARTLARKFNSRFGKTFFEPKALVPTGGEARILSLSDPHKKMSKSGSQDSYISLYDNATAIRQKIKRAVTDSGKEIIFNPEEKPAISNLITIYKLFSSLSMANIEKRFSSKGYKEFKNDLAEILISKLQPFQKKLDELKKNPKLIKKILADGDKKAERAAEATMKEVRSKTGLS